MKHSVNCIFLTTRGRIWLRKGLNFTVTYYKLRNGWEKEKKGRRQEKERNMYEKLCFVTGFC